jgi:hypothetical protein
MLDSDGESTPFHMKKLGLQNIGMFKHLVMFEPRIIRGEPVLIAAVFFDRDSFFDFILIALFLFFFIVYTFLSSSIAVHRQIGQVFKSFEEIMHDLKAPINLSKQLVESVILQRFDKSSELAKSAQASIEYALSLHKTLDLKDRNELKNICSINLKEFIETCISSIEIGSNKKIELTLPSVIIDGDSLKISRILHNLIQNAARHSKEKITINILENKNNVIVEIRNDGNPIPKEFLKRIFEPFVSTTGSGLGLYIAQRFTKLHGGEIKAVSDKYETIFSLYLPKRKNHTPPPKPEGRLEPLSEEEYTGKLLKVAVVEDDIRSQKNILNSLRHDSLLLKIFNTIDDFTHDLSKGIKYDTAIIDRYGPNFDAVETKVGFLLKDRFHFNGKLILYTNSSIRNPKDYGFNKWISKERRLNIQDIL